ncbi:MAG: TIGR03943 family protein [Candidatus Limiplasma sp.]|nr:TIGR03943 family protein [Candidatus Limiplasma sp.]
MRRAVNPVKLAEGLSAMLLALCLLWLALTRAYLHFVTPRTLPYLYFAAAALLAVGALDLARLFEVVHVRRYTPLLALLIPLLLLAGSITQQQLWSLPLFPAAETEPSATGEAYAMQAQGYEGRILHGYDPATQTLNIPQEETFFWLTEIYSNPTPFLHTNVHTMGKVLKNPKFFTSDCFSPSRELMTCCVADLYTIGFKCQFDSAQALSEGDWVSVTGPLEMVDVNGQQELRLLAQSVEPCEPPADPYVYAY